MSELYTFKCDFCGVEERGDKMPTDWQKHEIVMTGAKTESWAGRGHTCNRCVPYVQETLYAAVAELKNRMPAERAARALAPEGLVAEVQFPPPSVGVGQQIAAGAIAGAFAAFAAAAAAYNLGYRTDPDGYLTDPDSLDDI